MTEYALAPNRKFDVTNSPYRTPRVMLEQGLLSAYRVRSNGTMRHLELYPLGSTAREAAEYVSDRIDMDGASVQAVARELHVSTPTIRRFIEGLELTEEIEQGDWDGLSFDSAGNPVFDTGWVESEEAAEELGGDVDAIVDLLDNAPTVADIIEANSKGTDVAPRPVRRTRTSSKTDAELLAQNQARFTNVPGAQCEPVGTPVDEVEAALVASVAARGGALVACFCNELPGHRPGTLGCKNAIPRRTRSH